MAFAVIALGSNISPRRQNLEEAVKKMNALKACKVIEKSQVYETDPVGGPFQGLYLNAASSLKTRLSPSQLLQGLTKIENALGRVRLEPKGPRTIDLDIIFYDDLIASKPDLEIPHPRFRERGFVLFPLNDIIPSFIDPKTEKPIHQLLREWMEAGGKSPKCTGWL